MPDPHPLVIELRQALEVVDGSPDQVDKVILKIDRRLRKPKLWGSTRVAEHLGIRHNNIDKQKDLPLPVLGPPEMPRGRLWDPDDIRVYARRRKAGKKT